MSLQLDTISKINSLPEDLLQEVSEFIDYLAKKRHLNKSQEDITLSESDMNQYLTNLKEYENLLAEGKIKW